MISFGDWEMPRDYSTGTASEVKSCRTGSGLFDVSHMGEFRVCGSEALDLVQQLTTNDASRLTPGKAQYSLLLNEEGGVKDDVIVYCDSVDDFLIVVNAGCKDKDWDWFNLHAKAFRVRLTDESSATSLVAIQGPDAVSIVESMADASVKSLKRFHFSTTMVAGVPCTVSRTGYTGEDGFELFCCWEDALTIWYRLIEKGAVPCGLAARDVLRQEAAYPLYGHELNEHESPLGLGLGWAIKSSKVDFIGRDDLVKRSQDGLRERLVGLIPTIPNAIPREGHLVFADGRDEPIGRVTSGTLSPTIGSGIALARIGAGFAEPGLELSIAIRGRVVTAIVRDLPFYRGLDEASKK